MPRAALAFISLLIAVSMSALWVATQRRTLLVDWSGRGWHLIVRADAGRFCFERLQSAALATPFQGGWELTFPDGTRERLGVTPRDARLGNGYGFEGWTWVHTFGKPGNAFVLQRVAVPFWPLILMCFIPVGRFAAGAVVRRRRSSRAAAGLCPDCGYDLRAPPGRCPECGGTSSSPQRGASCSQLKRQ